MRATGWPEEDHGGHAEHRCDQHDGWAGGDLLPRASRRPWLDRDQDGVARKDP